MGTTGNHAREILAKIETTWDDLQSACDGLSDEDMQAPGVTGEWSVKDLLAHVTTWEEVTMTLSRAQLTGTPPPGGDDGEPWDLDRFNARTSAEKAALSLDEVRRQLAATHEELLAWIPTVPDDQLVPGSEVEDRLKADTWDHYPEHAAAIRAWRLHQGI